MELFEEEERPRPSEAEIEDTISKVKLILAHPDMGQKDRENAKRGYEKALELLERRETQYNIGKLISMQAKAIAVYAVDYLNGDMSQKHILNFSGIEMEFHNREEFPGIEFDV